MEKTRFTGRKGVLIGLFALALPVLAACNAVHGAGKDIESVGHAVQHGARAVQNDIDD